MNIVTVYSSVLRIGDSYKHGRSICGRCMGKRFDARHNGGVRKRQRCRGKGYTEVGGTKR